jgi:hypothetical protein
LSVPHAYPGLRLNVVCPSMTLTGTVAIGTPVNQPIDIAKVIAGIDVSGSGREAIKYDESQSAARQMGKNAGWTSWDDQNKGLNGRAIYVAGGDGWDVQEGLDRTQHWRRPAQQRVNESKKFDRMFSAFHRIVCFL